MMTMDDIDEELRYLDSREGELDTTCVSTIEHMRELLARAKAWQRVMTRAERTARIVDEFLVEEMKGFKP